MEGARGASTHGRSVAMELLVFVLLVMLFGLLAVRWGVDSTPRVPDDHHRSA